jgi:hypothetical protein
MKVSNKNRNAVPHSGKENVSPNFGIKSTPKGENRPKKQSYSL